MTAFPQIPGRAIGGTPRMLSLVIFCGLGPTLRWHMEPWSPIIHNNMIIKSKFKTAWWLPGPHLQTIWPTIMRRRIELELLRERVERPDGDFIELDWSTQADKTAPIVMILHGLEGSIESNYVRGLFSALQKEGYRVVLMHFRGCSGEHNRLLRAYHSGETADIALIVNFLKEREPNTAISAVGFSLGGNVLLKWLGETQEDNPLEKAVAISVPFELHKLADRMDKGLSRFYQNYLLKSLCEKFKSKHEKMNSIFDVSQMNKIKSLWAFDDQITAPIHGFENAMDYYQKSSSRQFLKSIRKPTLILHAEDDPFMTTEVIPVAEDLSGHVTLELSKGGGHVGFIHGSVPGAGKYWLEERIPEFLQGLRLD